MIETQTAVIDHLHQRRENGMQRSAVSYFIASVDALLIVASAIASGMSYHYIVFGYLDSPAKYLAIGLVFAAGFVLLMVSKGYYKPSVMVFTKQTVYILACSFLLTTFLALVVFLVGASDAFSRGAIAIFAASSTVGIIASRVLWANFIQEATTLGSVQKKKILLISGSLQTTSSHEAKLRDLGLEPIRTLAIDDEHGPSKLLANLSVSMSKEVSEVYVMTEGMSRDVLQGVIKELRALPVPVHLILDTFVSQFAALPVSTVGDITVVEMQRAPLNRAERFIKRCFDIAFAAGALFFFGPLMLLVAIAIKLDSPGPVFFFQQRRGFNNQPFDIVKFRSMSVMESGAAMTQAVRNDARVTRVGKFIRSTSVDELPQFWNVLVGHMSIVGPRPHAVSQEDHYDRIIARYAFRRHVKPGITGWAQINGHRGATPTITNMEDRLEHDLWYMHHWSLWLDIRIALRSFAAMFDRSSAF